MNIYLLFHHGAIKMCVYVYVHIYIYKYIYIYVYHHGVIKASFNSTIYLSIQVYTCIQLFTYVSYKYTIHTGAACQL